MLNSFLFRIHSCMKPASRNLHNKDMINHAGSMAKVFETCKSCFAIILNNRTLIEFYTNETRMHEPAQQGHDHNMRVQQ